jgi:hypothetical protein
MGLIEDAEKHGLVAIQVNEKAKVHYSHQKYLAICGLEFDDYKEVDVVKEWELCRMCRDRVKTNNFI